MEWCGRCLGYLHTARLVVLLRWDLAKGILAKVDPNWFPLEFRLGDGRGKWRFPAPLFPQRAEFYLLGLNNSPSQCPLTLPTLQEQSC